MMLGGEMKFLIFLYYLISFSTGFAALAIILLIFARYRIPTLKNYIIWLCALTLLLVLNNIEYFRITILPMNDPRIIFIERTLSLISYGMLFFFQPLYIYQFLRKPFSVFHRLTFGFLSAVPLCLVFLPFILGKGWNFVFGLVSLVSTGIMIYINLLLLTRLFKQDFPEKKGIMRIFLLLNCLFLPLWLLESQWNSNLVNQIRPLSFSHLYYFIWNLLTVIYMSKFIFTDSQPLKTEDISDQFCGQYGITQREKEIVAMIARGMTNKGIASELDIAVLTVKTHVYNIYQKTKAQSKIDLINKVASSKRTGSAKIIELLS
jgi:DNA-binding CsgD family transcriptional regulator